MQIYIHVPFCRTKCHYCGFYSIPRGNNINNIQLLPEKDVNDFDLNEKGINLFREKKYELENILVPKNSKKDPNNFSETIIVKTDKIKTLSSLIPNVSKSSTQKNHGIQSLSDVLRHKKDGVISQKTQNQHVVGKTLADAFLPKDQIENLRNSLGFPQLEREKIDSEKNNISSSSLFKDTSNPQASLLLEQERQKKEKAKKIQSFFLGKSSQQEDYNFINSNARSALNGGNISTLDKGSRFPLPLALPKNFTENNKLSQDSLYKLWKKGLLTEIKILSEFYTDSPITSIFFGGGTPSIIPIKDMEAILQTLFRTFYVNHNAEISMEANPESITKEKAIAYSRMGFNRISLGIQSLQDDNLKSIGRAHSAMDAIKAFHALRDARFHNISIDFIWGLPNQKNKNWRMDIKEAIGLDPEHISCYGLSIDEGSLFDDLEKKGTLHLPTEKEQALMYRTTADLLEGAGYLQYEISNFSKIGYQCRHNLGYWQGADYMGLGPAAASTINNIRRTHASSIIEWAQDIQKNNLGQDIRFLLNNKSSNPALNPNFNTEILSKQDRVLELIMLRLRTTKGLALSEYKELTGHSFMSHHKPLIHILDKHNLLRISKGHVFLTPNGMLVSSSILERFFENIKDIFRHEQ